MDELTGRDASGEAYIKHKYVDEDGLCSIERIYGDEAEVFAAYVESGATPEQCEGWAKAAQEGRLVVLPCKVNDIMHVLDRDGIPHEMRLSEPDIQFVCTDEENLCNVLCNRKPNGFCAYRMRNDGSDMYKAIFFTREEAEAGAGGSR